jgi:hypothetical protein
LNPIGQPKPSAAIPNHKTKLARLLGVESGSLHHKGNGMTVTTLGIAHIQPIVSLIAGILILVMPQLLNYIVAIFLIVSGILGLGLIQ